MAKKKISGKPPVSNSQHQTTKTAQNYYLILGCILLITILVYKKVCGFEITNFDDDQSILMNPYIQDFSWSGIKKMFTGYNLGMYAPVGIMFYSFLYSINGADAQVFHTASLLLHLCNIILVFWVLRILLKDNWKSLAITALFALHPLNTEPVAWISANTTLLFNSLLLVAIIAYTFYKSSGKYYFLIITGIFFLFSILVKSAAVTLTPILLIIDYFFYKINRKAILEKIPFLILTLIFSYMTFVSRNNDMMGVQFISNKYNFFERIMMVAHTIPFYLTKFLIPINLSFNYPFPENGQWPILYYFTLLLLPLLFILIYYLGKKNKWVFFGFIFYMATISVMLPLFTVGNFELRSDRYNYLGIVGLSLVLLEIVTGVLKDSKKSLFVISALSLVFGIISYGRADAWQNSMAIWDDGIKKNPEQCMPYFNKGVTCAATLGNDEALKYYYIAIEKDSTYFPAYINIGNIMFSRNNYEEAYKFFKKGYELDTTQIEIARSVVVCAMKARNFDLAFVEGQNLISRFPSYANGYGVVANVYNDSGKYEEALQLASKGIALDSNAYDCYFQKGFAEIKLNLFANAINSYNLAEKIKADDPYLYFNRAFAYNFSQQLDKGCIDMKKAKDLGVPNCDPYLATCL
jgi:tetratricopeptide (TPR) repeat protein